MKHNGKNYFQTRLPFTTLQNGIDVIIRYLAVFGSKHVCGAVTDNGQHLILPQFVCTGIYKSSYWIKKR